ncbi:MAG: tetratricopeptide repeat protein, partial [Oleiharenicola lentus]
AKLTVAPDISGRPAELGRILREALARVDQESASVESVVALGGIYHINNLVTEAEACWKFLHGRQPKEARWCYFLSDISRMRADDTGLRAWLEQTVQFAPDYAPAWLELGDLEFKTGHLDRAAEAYRQRVRLVPGDPYGSLGLARIALQQDRRAEGKALIEELVKRVPNFPSSHNIYAEILAQEGDQIGAANQRWLGTVAGRFRAAPDPWKEALRAWCCDVDQLIVWGSIDFQTKQGDRGKAAFEKAVSLEPRNPQGYENLGMYYLEEGNPAKAAEVLEQGSALPGCSERMFSSLGDAYLALRQPDKALAV